MGCPACRDYEWEDQQDTIAEINGEGFCIFHAPFESKGITDEEFNARVFDRLMMAAVERVQGNTKAYCNLNGVVFPGHISFAENRYFSEFGLPDVTLFKAQFHGFADFSGLKFQGEAGFNEAIFHQRVRFAGAKFQGEASFYSATFKGMADFRNSIFRDSAMFHNAQFLHVSKFNDVVFESSSIFSDVLFRGEAIFSDITATNQVVLKDLSVDSVRNIVFRRKDISIFTLQTCKWADRLGLDVYGNGEESNLIECEELYRAMKQRAAGEHDQPKVSNWHFREKLMFKKQRWYRRWLPITLTWWYWTTSGFGEKPVRAGGLLFALAVVVFVLMGTANMVGATPPTADVDLSERLHAGLQHLLFIASPQYTPAEPLWRSALLVLTRVLIPLQFTLFALAVRNRFRR